MHTLTVTLKQHTPIIHFQHDQDGATLRASEVKPKLDKYILKKLKEENITEYNKGIAEGWIKQKNDKIWLAYKMTIVPSNRDEEREGNEKMSLYFGNINSTLKKLPSYYKTLDLTIYSNNNELEVLLLHRIRDIIFFFFTHNFGTRQTKGYGSFTVIKVNNDTTLNDGSSISNIKPIGYKSFFTSDKVDVFSDIGLLHKTLRSGINGQSTNSLYFKSLMFTYARENIWDKKSIKFHFLNDATTREVEVLRQYNLDRIKNKGKLPRKSNPSMFKDYRHWRKPKNNNCGTVNLRDYLGFSSNESWMAYDTGVFQADKNDSTKVATNKYGEYILKKMTVTKSFDANFKDVGRFKSPILYKPIQSDSGQWTVYIYANDKTISEISGKKVYYKSNMPKTSVFNLEMSPDFSITDFLDKSFSHGANVAKFFSVDFKPFDRKSSTNRSSDNDIYDSIVRIYSELKANKV